MHPIVRLLVSTIVSAAIAPAAPRAHAQQTTAYERHELTIPVRDGIKLFAVALIPKGMSAPLPILLIRTPFSAAGAFRNADLPANVPRSREGRTTGPGARLLPTVWRMPSGTTVPV